MDMLNASICSRESDPSKYEGQSGRYIGLAFYVDQVCVELSSLCHLADM